MDDGFTGFDPSLVKSQIEEFNTQAVAVQTKFMRSSEVYIGYLSSKWTTPLCEVFEEWLNGYLISLNQKLIDTFSSIVISSCNAYNHVAASMGTESLFIDAGPFVDPDFDLYNDDRHVAVTEKGMFPQIVKDITTDYLKCLEEVNSDIDSLPRDIGIYDPTDAIKTAFSNQIDSLRQEFETAITDLADTVGVKIDENIAAVKEGILKGVEALTSKLS